MYIISDLIKLLSLENYEFFKRRHRPGKTHVAKFFIVYLAYNFIQLDGILIFSIKYDDNNAL